MQASFLKSKSLYCLGIDPTFHLHLECNPFLKAERERLGDNIQLTERACLALLDACQNNALVGKVKFQSAYFEALGAKGFDLMFSLSKTAHSRGLGVLVDAKRGDISSTMAAYGQCFLGKTYVDALTVTPYMGMDVIKPLVPWLKLGKMIYVVLSSSNQSGFDFHSQELADGRTVAEYMFDNILEHFYDHREQIGFVVGATIVDKLSARFIAKLQSSRILLPGFGAQGAQVNDAITSLIQASGSDVTVPVSRGFSLFGLEEQVGEIESLSSWEQYTSLVQKAIKSMSKVS